MLLRLEVFDSHVAREYFEYSYITPIHGGVLLCIWGRGNWLDGRLSLEARVKATSVYLALYKRESQPASQPASQLILTFALSFRLTGYVELS